MGEGVRLRGEKVDYGRGGDVDKKKEEGTRGKIDKNEERR